MVVDTASGARGGQKEVVIEVQAVSAAAPGELWRWIADTNRFNRVIGGAPATYRHEKEGGRIVRRGASRMLGRRFVFREEPYEWVTGRFVHAYRVYQGFFISRSHVEIALEPIAAGGTRVRARLEVALAPGLVPRVASLVSTGRLRRQMQDLVDAVAAHPDDPVPPQAVGARRTPPFESELRARAGRLAAAAAEDGAPLDPALVARLVDLLRDRPDDEVLHVRPFVLARRWGVDRFAVLRVLLHAGRAGLVDLSWDVRCPSCRGVAHRHEGLRTMKAEEHCDACELDFGIDLGREVELTFSVNHGVRPVPRSTWCLSGPDQRAHVVAQIVLRPGEERELSIDLAEGSHTVKCVGARERTPLRVSQAGAAGAAVRATVEDGRVRLEPSEAAPGRARFLARSQDAKPAVVLLERADEGGDWLSAAAAASLAEFRDLYARELLADGVTLDISTACILFTDLEASTAMYTRLGDAPAFARVRAHFEALAAAFAEERGTIVKTIGDAVMAAFVDGGAALRAAFTAHRRMREVSGRVPDVPPLVLKIGLHQGPCLMVTLNERLDYFGTAVNAAARLQGLAHGGEVVVAESLLDSPSVRAALADQDDVVEVERTVAELKGLPSMRVVRLRVRPPTEAASRARVVES